MISCICASTADKLLVAGLCGTCLRLHLVNSPHKSTALRAAKCVPMSRCIQVHLASMEINPEMATRVVFKNGVGLGFVSATPTGAFWTFDFPLEYGGGTCFHEVIANWHSIMVLAGTLSHCVWGGRVSVRERRTITRTNWSLQRNLNGKLVIYTTLLVPVGFHRRSSFEFMATFL